MSTFEQWSVAFSKLQLRERYLLCYGSVALVLYLGLMFLFEPLWQRNVQLQQQQQNSQRQLAGFDEQISALQQLLSQDPNETLRQQLTQLQQQEQQVLIQIRDVTGRYVSAAQMLQLLQDVLRQQQQVQLVALENLAAQPLQLTGSNAETPLLYRHRTRLTFRGDYVALQQLLSRLQQLPWQLHWQDLHYEVKQHPQAELQLQLETLSEYENYLQI